MELTFYMGYCYCINNVVSLWVCYDGATTKLLPRRLADKTQLELIS
jgi:hypothetical protein